MPAQQIPPAAPVVPGGGAVSRRHAKLLHHLFENNGGGGGAPVKDLRIRRVVPPASAPPPDCSPDPPAPAAKPVPVPAVQIQAQAQARAQSTPPEPSAVAAAEDRERKPPMLQLPRSKLVRDPASFGYRRLLPFLNQMAAANNGSDLSLSKDAPSEPRASVPNKELAGSNPEVAADESVDGSQGGAANVVEQVAAEAASDRASDCSDTANEEPKVAVEAGADRQMRDSCDTVREEEPKVVSTDPAASKPCVTRCARSKFVHHPSSSFSYKRMLPFLMENDISSQEEEENRCKIRRVSSEEEQLASDGNEEHNNGAQVDRVVEEQSASVSGGNCAGQIQSVSSTAEVQNVTQEQELASDMDAAAPGGGQGQPAVVAQDDSPRESDVAGAEATVQLVRKDSESDEKPVPMEDSAEPQSLAKAAGGDQEMKDRVKEQTNIVPAGDVASSKPCLPRCTRSSRLVHHRNSFSYKRMLPFLMENHEITSPQGGDRTKLQTVPEEKQLTSDQSDLMASSGDRQLPALKDSAEASYEAELERIVEEIASSPYENCLVTGGQLQYAVAEVSSPGGSAAQVQKVTQEVALCLDKDGDGVLAGVHGQLSISEDSPKESSVAEAERIVVEEEAADNSDRDLQPAVSDVSPREGDAEKEATPKPALTSDGDDARRLTSDKGESLVKDQPQLCQSSESGCPDVGFGSPTNTVTVDNGRADRQERADSPSLEKRCLSPNKLSPVSGGLKKRVLSPKKGILKRPANGCKGICMCLDCSVFRLRADRAFEFSRKQMEEADDIIGNLLQEVASLRSLAAGKKPSGQQEQIEEACQRASRVEEVARERQRQMQAELNAHCKIPGPRVKFAQYVDEKMAASSSPLGSSRRQPPL